MQLLLYAIGGLVLGALVVTILGSPVSMTLYLAGLWLSVVTMVSAVSLAESYRNRSPALNPDCLRAGSAWKSMQWRKRPASSIRM